MYRSCVSGALFAGFLLCFAATSEVLPIPVHKGRRNSWHADTIYLGAGMTVVDESCDVLVARYAQQPEALGQLYLMVPGVKDSARFVFHNVDQFAQEQDTVNLGRFPRGTRLEWMYMVVDSLSMFSHARHKKVYTGENRPGHELYVSEMDNPLGRRWAVVGTAGPTACEVGFAAAIPGSYRDIRFRVSNVELVK